MELRWLLPFVAALSPALYGQADAALFDDTVVQEVRLTVDPAAWQTLRDNFHVDDYYSADFTWNGTSLKNIGIRSRGSGSRSPQKPNLALKFNKYVKQKFLGHNTIQLKANNQDGSMMREYLTMSLMRRLGLPAPREAPARLYINGEFFGLYTIVEHSDEDYLKRLYGESSGYLYDFNPTPNYYHFDYLGDNPEPYGNLFEAETHESEPEWSKLYEMLREINASTAATFPTVGPTYVDLPGFMKILAVETYVAESDGFLSDVFGMNNFSLYRPEGSKQFRFLPWDTDYTMNWAGRPLFQNMDGNQLAKRALAVPALRQIYVETLLQAVTVAGRDGGWLRSEMDRLYALIGPDARRDPNKQCWRSNVMVACDASDFEREVAVIKNFAVERFDNVEPQMVALLGPMQPVMAVGGAVNAATHQAGLVPGSLAVVYGSSMARTGESAGSWPLPLTLGNTEVTVNGVAAPLLFVSPFQINFQVPWNLQEGAATVEVSVDGASAPSLQVELLHAAPGVFSASHADFSPVNAAGPAQAGETLMLFTTGLGPVENKPQDGEAAPADILSRTTETVTATVNGVAAEVLFSGLAPHYAGVYQVNVKMPSGLAAGDGSLILRVAGKASPAFRVPVR